MVLDIFILVVFQVLVAFNRPHLLPHPDPKRKDEGMEGAAANDEPVPLPGNSNICIEWEILHRHFGVALALSVRLMMAWSFMKGSTLNLMHYNCAGRYSDLGMRYG